MRGAPLLALPLLLLALTGCGSSASSSSASSATSASTPTTGGTAPARPRGPVIHAAMKSLAFVPASIHARVGQRITWTNQDTPPHNVTYVSGPKFASSPPEINPGQSYTITLTAPGTIHYFCSIHPFMRGTIVVSR